MGKQKLKYMLAVVALVGLATTGCQEDVVALFGENQSNDSSVGDASADSGNGDAGVPGNDSSLLDGGVAEDSSVASDGSVLEDGSVLTDSGIVVDNSVRGGYAVCDAPNWTGENPYRFDTRTLPESTYQFGCGRAQRKVVSVVFAATEAGLYTFRLNASAAVFDAMRGSCVGNRSFICDDENEPLRIGLKAGEVITLHIASNGRDETRGELSYTFIPEDHSCNPQVLPTNGIIGNSGTDGVNLIDEECASFEVGLTWDDIYVWTAPTTGVYNFNTSGTDAIIVLSLRSNCSRVFPSETCHLRFNQSPSDDDYSTVQRFFHAGESVYVVASGSDMSTEYRLNVEAPDTSCEANATRLVGETVDIADTTVGEDVTYIETGCGENSTPDKLYVWTSPRSGFYEFEGERGEELTENGITYNIIFPKVSMRPACNENYDPRCRQETWENLRQYIPEGETVYLTVSAYQNEQGRFRLHIRPVANEDPLLYLQSVTW